MKRNLIVFLASVSMLASTSCVRVFHHSPEQAADEAIKFARVAFIDHNSSEAHDLMWPTIKKVVSLEQLQDAIQKMHPNGYPLEVTATEYEPIMGEKQVNVFLVGRNDGEKFYYRLVMCGTSASGYQVGGLFRGNQAPPPSKLRKPLKKTQTAEQTTAPNHGLESTSAPPAAGTLETHP